MAAKPLKITFSLDEEDVAYFRSLFRHAKKQAALLDPHTVTAEVQGLIARVRSAKKTPSFVQEAVEVLEKLLALLEDTDYAIPPPVASQVLTALAYFANPQDLVPDHIPGLGFLDDAIMVKIMQEEFEDEIWAYDQFAAFRKGAEQRPWTQVARERLPKRLVEKRKELRAKIEERRKRKLAQRSKQAAERRSFW